MAPTTSPEAPHDAQWYRDIGDQYAQIAATATSDLAKSANSAEASKYYGIAARLSGTVSEPVSSETLAAAPDGLLESLGFVPSYYLCRHPAWPDPLHIWPSTAEHAEKTFNDHPHPDAYVMRIWEKGPREIVHPARGQHEGDTATTESQVAP